MEKLQGLTIVLVDGTTPLRHERAVNVAFEAFLANREIGGEIRLFTVTDRLIELREIPESFGSLYAGPSRIANAVNRVSILRPRRVVLLTGVFDEHTMLGELRDGTTGYVWAEQFVAQPDADGKWRALETAPAGVVREMMRVEKEFHNGATKAPVR